jgi:hypothetical protein
MDKLRVSKVEWVLLQHGSQRRKGTLHLTNHHLIFVDDDDGGKEEWIAYSLLWHVTRLPSIAYRPKQRLYAIAYNLRDFRSLALAFESDSVAHDVFESVKALAVVEVAQDLYAFYYHPKLASTSGWKVYDVKAEFARQGVGRRTKAWRLCDVNAGYGMSVTYPSLFCVPSRISDSTIRYAAKFRSKERLPALSYLHRTNLATITRCSQPMVGLNNRSTQDEKLVEAIFGTHDDVAQTVQPNDAAMALSDSSSSGRAMVYGSTTTNLIIDARPTTNAMANRAKGAGTENMDFYRGCKKVYLGIENIHVMRDSLHRVTMALRAAEPPFEFADDSGSTSPSTDASSVVPLDHLALKRSGWLKHITTLLEGCLVITRNVHINNSHVLIHCSDGWDRTSQLSALAQICLDPYFRTMRGFAVLVEKDWISFGHRFWDRCGHASSDKYFVVGKGEADLLTEGDDVEGEGAAPPAVSDAQAGANAFWDFTKQIRANFQQHEGQDRGAHLKEISPVFHQFLDCVWQIMRQNPRRFEFNEQWLLDLFRAQFECKFGTFLYNSESERNGFFGTHAPASSRTTSVWDEMLADDKRQRYVNPRFEASLDEDLKRSDADMGVLMPNAKDVGFWGGLFRRDAKDMNSLVVAEAEERKSLVERLRQEDAERSEAAERRAKEEQAAQEASPVYNTTYKPRLRTANKNAQRSAADAVQERQEEQQEAAERVKNFFSGWGTRLQDAYVNATSVAASPSEELPRVVEAGHFARPTEAVRDNVAPIPKAPLTANALPAANATSVDHANPWATMPVLADSLADAGTQSSHTRKTESASQLDLSSDHGSFDPLGVSHVN